MCSRIGVGWNTRELCKYLQETPRLDFSPFEVVRHTANDGELVRKEVCVFVYMVGGGDEGGGGLVALYTFAIAAFRYDVL